LGVTDASSKLSSNLVKGSAMKIYPGAPHGLSIHKDKFNAALLARFGPDRRPLMIAR
jgi:hypothetical protein